MKKNFLFWMFALILIVQTPFIFAIECSGVSSENQQICNEIKNSGLTEQEIDLLISNLEYSNKTYPEHDYVYERNINLNVDSPPKNTPVHESDYIKNVWASALTAMPSVLYNGSLYVSDEITILSAFDHNLDIPENYEFSSYGATDAGDCRRTYTLLNENAENTVYVNNAPRGTGKIVQMNIDADSEIKIIYRVNINLRIDHYRWRRTKENIYCRYSNSEYKSESVEASDKFNVKHYDSELDANVELLDSYQDTIKFKVNHTNSISLDIQDEFSYSFDEFLYSIEYSKAPYYIYTLKAEEYNQESTSNLIKTEDYILINNLEGCKFEAYDFFNTIESDCDLPLKNLDLYIKTEKLKYKLGEEIEVKIYPEDIFVEISYGDEKKIAKDTAKFIAKPSFNKITANYNNREADKVVFVEEKERFRIIWDFFLLTLFNYFLYGTSKKFVRRFL